MITAARCPVVASFNGTRRVKESGVCCHSHLARPTLLAPRLLSPACRTPSTCSIASRLTIFASSGKMSYSSEDVFKENSNKALAYSALSTAFFAAGVIKLVFSRALQFYFTASRTPDAGLYQALAIVHFIAAIAANCLSDAASHDRLSSDACKRLNFGLVTWGAATLAASFRILELAFHSALIPFYAMYVASALLPVILSWKDGLFAPLPPFTPWRQLFTAQSLYDFASGLSLLFAIAVGYNIYNPGGLKFSWMAAPLNSSGSHAITFLGAGALLVHQVLVTLQDAARHGRLGSATIRNLNWGIALLSGAIMDWAVTGVKTKMIKSYLISKAPLTVAGCFTRCFDILSEFAFFIVVILGCFSLYAAIAGSDK